MAQEQKDILKQPAPKEPPWRTSRRIGIHTSTAGGVETAAERAYRIAQFHAPYHAAITCEIDTAVAKGIVPALVSMIDSMSSFPMLFITAIEIVSL